MPDLEPGLQTAYKNWSQEKTPESTGRMLESLSPVLDQGMRTFVGQDNPILRSKGKQLALSAMESYDPKRGTISTHVMNHLRGLQRESRKQLAVLPVPQRQYMQYSNMQKASQDLEDQLGRSPTAQELSEHMGWPLTKIQQLQRSQLGVPASTLGEEGGGMWLPGVGQTQSTAWLDLIYPDMTPQQQLIVDHTLGRNGKKQLSNQDLAKKLKVTPGFISQQKLRIQKLLDQEQRLSPF